MTSQPNHAVPGDDLANAWYAHDRSQSGVIARLDGFDVQRGVVVEVVKYCRNVQRPNAVKRQVLAFGFTEYPSVRAQAALGSQIVQWCNSVTAPRRQPIGPAHPCPTANPKHSTDFVDYVERVWRVFEHVRTQHGVKCAVSKRKVSSIAACGGVRTASRCCKFAEIDLDSADRCPEVFHRSCVVTRTAPDIGNVQPVDWRKRFNGPKRQFAGEVIVTAITKEPAHKFQRTQTRRPSWIGG